MYGTTLSDQLRNRPTPPTNNNKFNSKYGDTEKNKDKEKDKDDRNMMESVDELPDWVLAEWHSISAELRGGEGGRRSRNMRHRSRRRLQWRMLHKSQYAEAHEIDIGDGYSFRVHKLLDGSSSNDESSQQGDDFA